MVSRLFCESTINHNSTLCANYKNMVGLGYKDMEDICLLKTYKEKEVPMSKLDNETFANPEHFPLTMKIITEIMDEKTDPGTLFGFRSRLDMAIVMTNKDALKKKCEDFYEGHGKSMAEWYKSPRIRGWIDQIVCEKLTGEWDKAE